MTEDKEIPVWQLTDGTVIVQGQPAVAQAIKAKRFTWQATDGVLPTRTPVQMVRHWLYIILEKI